MHTRGKGHMIVDGYPMPFVGAPHPKPRAASPHRLPKKSFTLLPIFVASLTREYYYIYHGH
jgi:hypothetical protein